MDRNGASGELLTAGVIIKYCYRLYLCFDAYSGIKVVCKGLRPLKRPVRSVKPGMSYYTKRNIELHRNIHTGFISSKVDLSDSRHMLLLNVENFTLQPW